MGDEFSPQDLESLPLPKDWTANVRHAVLNVIGIVRIAMLAGREFLIQEDKPLLAHVHRLETEVAMLREELRINGARTSRIDPAPAAAVLANRTDGDSGTSCHAWLEQGRNRATVLRLR